MGKNSLIANFLFLIGPIFIGGLVFFASDLMLSAPNIMAVTTALIFILGLVCLLVAKFSLFKKGIFVSFGAGNLTKNYKNIYYLSYILFGIGLILIIALVIVNTL